MDHQLSLINREEVALNTYKFTFSTKNSNYTYKAGQNADFTLINPPKVDSEGNTRTFSLVSSPTETGVIAFATRIRETAFKQSLIEMPLGTYCTVSDAMGSFVLGTDTSKPAVFLAGGIGITPMLSIIRYATDSRLDQKIILFFSNGSLAEAPFYETFKELANRNLNFSFVPTLTKEKPADWAGESGRISEDLVKKYVPDLSQAVFYASGSAEMVKNMVTLAKNLGATEDRIITEDFPGY